MATQPNQSPNMIVVLIVGAIVLGVLLFVVVPMLTATMPAG